MASTQKIILTVLMINLLIVSIPAFMQARETGSYQLAANEYTNLIQDLDEKKNADLDDEQGFFQRAWTTLGGDFVEGIWNKAKIAGSFIGIFVSGLVPFGASHYATITGATIVETFIVGALDLFRITLWLLLTLELYLLLVNRKTGG
jgi:hypothetical protein